jgi:hypothetical protein
MVWPPRRVAGSRAALTSAGDCGISGVDCDKGFRLREVFRHASHKDRAMKADKELTAAPLRIARHPALFDGILYRSRVTLEPCMVLWLRPGGRDLESEICRSLDGSGAIHSDRNRSGRPAIYKRGSPSCPPPISKYEVSAADIGEFSRQDQRGTTDSRSGPTGIRTLNQRIMSPLL